MLAALFLCGILSAEGDPTLSTNGGIRLDPLFRQRIVEHIESDPRIGDCLLEYSWERNYCEFNGRESAPIVTQSGRYGMTRIGSEVLFKFQVLRQDSFGENARSLGPMTPMDWLFFEGDFIGCHRGGTYYVHFPGGYTPDGAIGVDSIEDARVSFSLPQHSGLAYRRPPELPPNIEGLITYSSDTDGWTSTCCLEEPEEAGGLTFYRRQTEEYIPGTRLSSAYRIEIIFILPDETESEPYLEQERAVQAWMDEFPKVLRYREFDPLGAVLDGRIILEETDGRTAAELSLRQDSIYTLTKLQEPTSGDRVSVADIIESVREISVEPFSDNVIPRLEMQTDGTVQERMQWNEQGKVWITTD